MRTVLIWVGLMLGAFAPAGAQEWDGDLAAYLASKFFLDAPVVGEILSESGCDPTAPVLTGREGDTGTVRCAGPDGSLRIALNVVGLALAQERRGLVYANGRRRFYSPNMGWLSQSRDLVTHWGHRVFDSRLGAFQILPVSGGVAEALNAQVALSGEAGQYLGMWGDGQLKAGVFWSGAGTAIPFSVAEDDIVFQLEVLERLGRDPADTIAVLRDGKWYVAQITAPLSADHIFAIQPMAVEITGEDGLSRTMEVAALRVEVLPPSFPGDPEWARLVWVEPAE